MTIEEIVYELNAEAHRYEFGKLQEIRKQHRGLRKLLCQQPFWGNSTFPDEGYAYHAGGSDELQFNVGLEDQDFRWGLALSLMSYYRMLWIG